MKEVVHYIAVNWVDWLFTAVSGAALWSCRGVLKHQKESAKKDEAIQEGVQSLLRDRIIQGYNHYHDKGYCPIYAKENVKRMYDAYHALGGNDVATKLKDTLLEMREEPEERED